MLKYVVYFFFCNHIILQHLITNSALRITSIESNADTLLLFIDGVGAYEHAKRVFMLDEFLILFNASQLMPFVLMFCGRRAEYF